ncbi:porin [Roseovarius salis]|uniref:porin n=1 Tax=Roseovarius salis TaxID=3376063 RepID=UPI0037CBC33B
MKKQLLCTSAIALGVAAAPAAAQEWNLDWGGFMSQHVGFGDISGTAIPAGVDPEGDGVDIHSTSEIIFSPSVTLDNGMTFGINVQLEGEQTAADIDETYMSISSDTFGRVDIGSENSAGYKSMVGAPGVTSMYINSPSTSTFIPWTGTGTAIGFRQAALSSYTEVAGNNDVQRISYYTPDFNGLTVGVSYAPTGAVNAANSFSVNKNAVLSDIFDIGMNYSNSFGATDITLSARWGTGDTPVAGFSDPETWGLGFQVGFNNITVGGSYTENDNGAPAGTADQEGWSFGATYDAAGPWSFEALTYQGEVDLGGAASLDREAYRIGASRTLGPGVDWDIYLLQEERDFNVTAGTDAEGTVLGTAINLSF